jgi:hypothetical protein
MGTERAPEAIQVGVPHRALRNLTAFAYPWGRLAVALRTVGQGTVFQPWEPSPHGLGRRVPITLGVDAAGHGWSAEAPDGLFLGALDVAERCLPIGTPAPAIIPPPQGNDRASPFDELPTITAPLRAVVDARPDLRSTGLELLEQLDALARQYASAAELELGAAGFDNTEEVRRHAATQEHLLRAANEVLESCRTALGGSS